MKKISILGTGMVGNTIGNDASAKEAVRNILQQFARHGDDDAHLGAHLGLHRRRAFCLQNFAEAVSKRYLNG